MTDPSTNGSDVLMDVSPDLSFVIDKEGRWFQNGLGNRAPRGVPIL